MIVTKQELWNMHAPNFNFELDEDEILSKALEREYVTQVKGEDNYLINDEYVPHKERREVAV
jgi:hypothetical protein